MKASNVYYNVGMTLSSNDPNKEWVIADYLRKGEVGFVNWKADKINYNEDELMATIAVSVSQGAWWCSRRAYTTKVLVINRKRRWLNPTLAKAMTRVCVYMPDNLLVAEEEPEKDKFVTRDEVLDFCKQNNIELVVINDGMTLASVWSGKSSDPHISSATFDLNVLKPFTDNHISVLLAVSQYDHYFKALSEPDIWFECNKFKYVEGIGEVAEYEVTSKHRNVEDVYLIAPNETSIEAQSSKVYHRYDDIEEDYRSVECNDEDEECNEEEYDEDDGED